jgi:hypothetical protein
MIYKKKKFKMKLLFVKKLKSRLSAGLDGGSIFLYPKQQ